MERTGQIIAAFQNIDAVIAVEREHQQELEETLAHKEEPERVEEYLKKVRTSSIHLLELVNEVLDIFDCCVDSQCI